MKASAIGSPIQRGMKASSLLRIMALPAMLLAILSSWAGALEEKGSAKPPVRFDITGRTDAIDRYLKGRSLDAVEGAWLSDDSKYEIAVFRSPDDLREVCDYVAIVTATEYRTWRLGEIKMLLKGTASEALYSATYYLANKSKQMSWATLTVGGNVMEILLPGRDKTNWSLSPTFSTSLRASRWIRTYPRTPGRSGGGPSSGGASSGSGFFVAPTVVATCFHVVEGAKQIAVVLGPLRLSATVLLQDEKKDLALLQVQAPDSLTKATLDFNRRCFSVEPTDAVKSGERVFVLGFPLSGLLGDQVVVSEGLVNSTVGPADDTNLLQVSVPIQPGNSGSPLINQHGQVVGVIVAKLSDEVVYRTQGSLPQNANFAVKGTNLAAMLSFVPGRGCADDVPEQGRVFDPSTMREKFGKAVVRIEVGK